MNVGFMFSTPYVWLHQHVIAHHSFPNIPGYDPDLYHSPEVNRHSQDVKHTKVHLAQKITFVIIWLVAVPLGLMWVGVYQAFKRVNYNNVCKFVSNEYLNPNSLPYRMAVFTFLMHILPFLLHGYTLKGFFFATVPIYVLSVCFMISSQINHLTPDNIEQFDKNFFKHQIITSHNVATSNYLVTVFTGGLNLQIEHHLFPSVNHVHLRKLAPLVQELCKKYNVHYNESATLWDALKQHMEHLGNFSFENRLKKE